MGVGGYLAEHRGVAAQGVDIVDGEVGAGLMGYGQQVEHRVGRSTHGNVEGHGVEHCLSGGYGAREHRFVAVAVVSPCVVNNLPGCFAEEFAAVDMSGHHSAVAGQSEADGLVE